MEFREAFVIASPVQMRRVDESDSVVTRIFLFLAYIVILLIILVILVAILVSMRGRKRRF